ncbi:hypothetical protein M5G27_26955 [Pseudomonas shahriarae]|jgi:hypothetical protein|uniref:Uncharacterized protein n=1 Tax=Pseudomonas shahriarae TaxID=2745512 RepID=A0A9X4HCK0_9PSED|nr:MULTISPECIES: hypothetical protein [Pseudomonas]KNH45252.1 hypothetical protein ACS73_16495 [Pseudomonas lini]MDD1011116.1 hypothetical protein [Pseudomonas shahriarae]POA78517.1 hypothetical protein C1890_09250 [Pseudomonas sp. DP16D-R1]
MNNLPIVLLILAVVVGYLYLTRTKKVVPRQDPKLGNEKVDDLHVSPNQAAHAKAANASLGLSAKDCLALRGATRTNQLPKSIDYSTYDEPTFQRRKIQLSF